MSLLLGFYEAMGDIYQTLNAFHRGYFILLAFKYDADKKVFAEYITQLVKFSSFTVKCFWVTLGY